MLNSKKNSSPKGKNTYGSESEDIMWEEMISKQQNKKHNNKASKTRAKKNANRKAKEEREYW